MDKIDIIDTGINIDIIDIIDIGINYIYNRYSYSYIVIKYRHNRYNRYRYKI